MDIHAHMEEAEGALFHFSLIRFSFWSILWMMPIISKP